jgi:dTDP-4-amino-4,6-dideoxygalactose transaminase
MKYWTAGGFPTMGLLCKNLRNGLVAETLGVKHALAMCNATAAIDERLNQGWLENIMALKVAT